MNKVIATFVLAVVLSAAGKADKHPTPGPVYSYYAPHPTTSAPTEASTTSLPPPPAAPYDAYYDSLYHSPYQSYQSQEPSDSGGLYYYYYPTANEIIDDTTLVPETTTASAETDAAVQDDFQFSGLQKLFMILIGIGIAFPSTLALTSVKRRKRGKTKAKGDIFG